MLVDLSSIRIFFKAFVRASKKANFMEVKTRFRTNIPAADREEYVVIFG